MTGWGPGGIMKRNALGEVKMEDNGFTTLPPGSGKCAGKADVPTARELRVLKEMRDLKARVRDLKARRERLVQAQGAEKEIAAIEEDLAGMRRRWEALEKERDAAAHERMVLLGHEE